MMSRMIDLIAAISISRVAVLTRITTHIKRYTPSRCCVRIPHRALVRGSVGPVSTVIVILILDESNARNWWGGTEEEVMEKQ